MHTVKVKEMVILNLIKHVSEFQIFRTVSEDYVINVLIEFVVMRRVFSDVTPQHNLTGLLTKIQGLHNKHDVLYIVRELFDHELIIVYQLSLFGRNDVKLESVNKNV